MTAKTKRARSSVAAFKGGSPGMVGFALFGAGRIGAVHAANIAASSKARLVAVHDVNAKAGDAIAARHGARSAHSAAEVLGDRSVEAVLIASSTDTHVGLITAAARAGKHIFCEKPIDLDMARVEQCRREIAGTGVKVQIGFNRRYDPSHAALAAAVEAGEIGTLEQLVITSRDPAIAPVDYLRVSGGIFRDMTIHDFDLARFIAKEEPVEVFATGSIRIEPKLEAMEDFDSAMVVMRTAKGSLIHINNSRRAVYGYDQRVEAFGAKGMIVSDNLRATSLRRSTKDATDRLGPLLHFFIDRYKDAYARELDDFIDKIQSGGDPAVGFEDGRRAQILAEAALESALTGKVVRVDYRTGG
jgi:myo-inositol 2-dehydrogenase / D-chiro-inositol 1-dehydrogenase